MYACKFFIVALCLAEVLLVEGKTITEVDQNPIVKILPATRFRRQTTYNCRRNECTNGVCNPQTYEGPDPPDWCKNSGGGEFDSGRFFGGGGGTFGGRSSRRFGQGSFRDDDLFGWK